MTSFNIKQGFNATEAALDRGVTKSSLGHDCVCKRGFRTREAARYLGVSKSFLDHARVNGSMEDGVEPPPFIKVGRTIRYLKEDLDHWLDRFPRYRHTSAIPDKPGSVASSSSHHSLPEVPAQGAMHRLQTTA